MRANEWRVRPAVIGDADVLAEFNYAIAQETEGKELPLTTLRRGVRRGLELGEECRYFVAESTGGSPRVLGALMLTREWSDWRDGWIVWVQSVYVRPAERGRGIFRSLIEHVLDTLQTTPDVIGVRLYVEQENHGAQNAYLKCGFDDPGYRVMECMFDQVPISDT